LCRGCSTASCPRMWLTAIIPMTMRMKTKTMRNTTTPMVQAGNRRASVGRGRGCLPRGEESPPSPSYTKMATHTHTRTPTATPTVTRASPNPRRSCHLPATSRPTDGHIQIPNSMACQLLRTACVNTRWARSTPLPALAVVHPSLTCATVSCPSSKTPSGPVMSMVLALATVTLVGKSASSTWPRDPQFRGRTRAPFPG
jgi:hypothetical protein